MMSAVEESEVNTLYKRPSDAGFLLITLGSGRFPEAHVDRSGSTGGLDECVSLSTSASRVLTFLSFLAR